MDENGSVLSTFPNLIVTMCLDQPPSSFFLMNTKNMITSYLSQQDIAICTPFNKYWNQLFFPHTSDATFDTRTRKNKIEARSEGECIFTEVRVI